MVKIPSLNPLAHLFAFSSTALQKLTLFWVLTILLTNSKPSLAGPTCSHSFEQRSAISQALRLTYGRTTAFRIVKARDNNQAPSYFTLAQRRLAFFFPPSSATSFSDLSNVKIFEKLGFTPDHLAHIRESGEVYYVVAIRDPSVRVANWDNVFYFINHSYNDAIIHLIHRHRGELMAMSPLLFDNFISDQRAPFDMISVNRAGPTSSPQYVTSRIFLRMYRQAKSDYERLFITRAFLFNEVGLKQQFSGDGFILNSDGSQGLPELMGFNKPFESYSPSDIAVIRIHFDQ